MLLPIFSFVLLADGVVFRFPLTTIRLCVRSMSTVALSALLAVAAATSGALAQTTSLTPLVDFTYAYSDLPYKVEPTGDIRGNQEGYNICNSTTQNQESWCQTLLVNGIDDWCLWSSPKPQDTIGESEGYEVAWCSKKGHGTRLMPAGTLQGVTHITTPDYVMIVAFIDQSLVNLQANDSGGELDPHGADLLGNPIGAMVYSNLYPTGNTNNNSYTQVIEWTEYIGSGLVCLKICDPSKTSANNVGLCNNIYDEIGINYNCPNSAQNGSFVVCDGDSMTPVGQYVSNGVTMTYSQPENGPVTSVPYTPSVPATSNCRTYQSTDLYTDLTAPTSSGASGSAATPAPTGSSGAHSGSGTGATRSGSGSPSATGAAAQTGGAASLRISAIATLAGVAFAVAFLA
ncbi:hypothetical protein AcV7_006190 [Taiwanofungus camphoratus]|nr:hypothetical protein AcV7_006190 [Antrodia cinnamomea]